MKKITFRVVPVTMVFVGAILIIIGLSIHSARSKRDAESQVAALATPSPLEYAKLFREGKKRFSEIPESKRTHAMYLEAIATDQLHYDEFSAMPDTFFDREMAVYIMKRHLLREVTVSKMEKIFAEKLLTAEEILTAAREQPGFIASLPEDLLTPQLAETALKADPEQITNFPEKYQTERRVLTAIREFSNDAETSRHDCVSLNNFWDRIPDTVITPRIEQAIVHQCPYLIMYIPTRRMTWPMCTEALRSDLGGRDQAVRQQCAEFLTLKRKGF